MVSSLKRYLNEYGPIPHDQEPNIMRSFNLRILLSALALLFINATAQAKAYGNYDPNRILRVFESPSGNRYGIDLQYLDQILDDLSIHANNYPPEFDTLQDRQRAVQNITMLSVMLDLMVNDPDPSPEILWRAGYLNSLGHNLDIAGLAQRANICFQKHLARDPDDSLGNYLYGKFLAETNHARLALPYLEKARDHGVVDATFALGMTCLALGDKRKALEYLKAYRQLRPADSNVTILIDAIQNGKFKHKTIDR